MLSIFAHQGSRRPGYNGKQQKMAKPKMKGVPHRKISETFLDFAAPLLNDLPGEAPEIPARNALIVCFTAWNAVIFSDVLKDDYFVDEVQRLTTGRPEAALAYAVFDQMVAPVNHALQIYRRKWGLPPIRRPDDTFSRLAQLCPLPPALDFPRVEKPSAFHYVGPFRDNFSNPLVLRTMARFGDSQFLKSSPNEHEQPIGPSQLGFTVLTGNRKSIQRSGSSAFGASPVPAISHACRRVPFEKEKT